MQKKISIFCIFYLLYSVVLWSSTIKIYYFFMPNCDNCLIFKNEIKPDIEKELNIKLELIEFDLSKKEVLDYFVKKKIDVDETPIILRNNKFYVGLGQIANEFKIDLKNRKNEDFFVDKELDKIIDIYRKEKQAKIINEEIIKDTKYLKNENVKDSINIKKKKVYIAYFYKTGCKKCSVVELYFKKISNEYDLNIKKYDITDSEGYINALKYGDYYGLPEEKSLVAPLIYIGNKVITANEWSNNKILEIIEKSSDDLIINYDEIENKKIDINKRINLLLNKIGPLSVILSGLIDGINPCAFATMIFFMSYLALLKRQKKDLFFLGTGFIIGSFLAYFLSGFSFFIVLKQLTIFHKIIKIIYFLTGISALIMSILSFRDAYFAKKGQFKEMELQLSTSQKKKIHKIIHEKINSKSIFWGSFLIGFLVSFQELACTGQIYLPTIMFIQKISEIKITAYLLLFLYNLFFILPITILFIFIYFGINSNKIGKIFEKKIFHIKILMGLLFILLGLAMIFLSI